MKKLLLTSALLLLSTGAFAEPWDGPTRIEAIAGVVEANGSVLKTLDGVKFISTEDDVNYKYEVSIEDCVFEINLEKDSAEDNGGMDVFAQYKGSLEKKTCK